MTNGMILYITEFFKLSLSFVWTTRYPERYFNHLMYHERLVCYYIEELGTKGDWCSTCGVGEILCIVCGPEKTCCSMFR